MPTGVSRMGARSLSAEPPAALGGGSGGSDALPARTATAVLTATRAPAPTLAVTPPAPEATAPTISIRTRSRARRLVHPVNPLAIVALVLGCLLSPLAALFGHLALAQLARSEQRGRLPAILAIVLGYLSLAVAAGIGIVDLVIHV
jgi:hypothetical protein